RVSLARLNLAELNVVRNEAGQTNVLAIVDKVRLHSKKHGGLKKLFGDFHFTGVDTLNFSLGRVRYIDLKDPRNSGEAPINLREQVYRDLTTKAALEVDLIMLWGAVGNRIPVSVNEIVQAYIKRETKTGQSNRKTNAPPKL